MCAHLNNVYQYVDYGAASILLIYHFKSFGSEAVLRFQAFLVLVRLLLAKGETVFAFLV